MNAWLVFALTALLLQQSDAETRIVAYLEESIEQRRPIEVSQLINEVFTTPEERSTLDRLYDSFFKIPLFLVQYQTNTGEIPTLQQLSDQFAFNGPETADVILQLMAIDPRIPDFFDRGTDGEIAAIRVDPVLNHPQFGQAVERSIAGWEGRPMPAFTTETFNGRPLRSDDLAGRPYMVYVWFSNCPPCVQTGPLLVDLYAEYGGEDFEIVAVNADRYLELPYDDQMRREYVERLGMEFTLGHLTADMQESFGGVSIFPTMFFVDRSGTIVRHFVNFQERDVLEQAILAATE